MLSRIIPTEDNICSVLDRGISNVADHNTLLNAKRIVIKVNLCKPFPPDSGATVDIRITENLVKLIRERNPNAEIYVVESNSSSRNAELAFRETGYLSLEKKYENLRLVNLSKTDQITIYDKRFRFFKKGLTLSSLFLSCDYFISVAKLKTHEFERYAGVLKNQFGCISDKKKEKYHPYLPKVIGDVNVVLKPDLCFIDGLVAMEGKGPSFGDPKEMNLLIIGNNPVATDAIATTIMGINPYSVPHLDASDKNGIGKLELTNIQIVGDSIDEVKTNFNFVPYHAFLFIRLGLKVRKLSHFFTAIGSYIVFTGKQLERLGRALYIQSFTEVLKKKAFLGLINKLRIPNLFHRWLLSAYIALRVRTG